MEQAEWFLKRRAVTNTLVKEVGIDEITASILANRGIKTSKEARAFLNPTMDNLQDPFLIKDIDKGTEIIKNAILQHKKITGYFDYDVDGITSCIIMCSMLKKCGANFNYHIPDRMTEGYGLNSNVIKKLKEEGTEVILTADNGISAIEQIKLANSLGITVVVTDHHDIPYKEDDKGKHQIFPDADAVIDPKRYDDPYSFKFMTGAGISYKFAKALYRKMNLDEKEVDKYLEYAALGTVCDVQDLVDENRIIVTEGLKQINNTENIGLKALIKECSLEDKKINSYTIGFALGPCMNASGRLDTAVKAVKLLSTTNVDEAESLAKELVELNKKRQAMCEEVLERNIKIIDSSSEYKNDKVIVVYDPATHESIAGIVAGKIRERYNKPTIVLTKATGQDGTAKGSGRSIEEYNMFEELMKVKNLMLGFGGHPMAAGMSLKVKNIDEFKEKLNTLTTLTDEDIIPKVYIDYRLPLERLSFNLVDKVKSLEPFGKGNPSPIFAEKKVEAFRVYPLGKDKKHIKLFCRVPGRNEKIDALAFNSTEKLENLIGREKMNYILKNNPANLKLDIIYSPDINEYKGNKSIQLLVKDFRLSK